MAEEHAPVITEKRNGVGWIRLNRPKALNSLNVEMVESIYTTLRKWREDEEVKLLCLAGEGEKGFCAGGDIRSLYEAKESNVKEMAVQFFGVEYKMDLLLRHYPKPVLTLMNGIVMGGGVGISEGTTYRIVSDNTKWAMPEMNIGFFPDVGASFFLNQMPGYLGRYLALTSTVIKAEDVIYARAADDLVPSRQWGPFVKELEEADFREGDVNEKVKAIISRFSEKTDVFSLQSIQGKIDKHFRHNKVEKIIESLSAERNDKWAEKTLQTIRGLSALSLKTTLEQIVRGEHASVLDCFQMEMELSMNFMDNPDFYEGVRSVLVDKDRNPQWTYKRLEDVTDNMVTDMFCYFDSKDYHPLAHYENVLHGNKYIH
ncbi:enoyl-CoA hydratase/isomerase family protein [Alteribacillus iranensis]|uniref:3-hydroxyisobutyryl-CoA hydrolase n=1 Tax=Alteribacillus iranensis TaxID=930128 RepID=A0A1I2BE93_9BACI|nr:enoyl-CoA hydratase/isomerase family protein [Alteribacillus iranensis]SFE53480.1 Enoyl-CoA hydratase/carnithine racemase [Alteribacillus iranensis]